MIKKLLVIIIVGMFVDGCGKKNVQLEDDLTPRFDKAMDFFERDKFYPINHFNLFILVI